MAIQLITDSTSYIPEDLIKQYGLNVVPLRVHFDDADFLDLPADFASFYKKLATVDYIPKSSQPPVAEMAAVFEDALKDGNDIIGVFLSSKMSGTYNTACMLKKQLLEDYPTARITIIDGTSNSMQLGLCVLAGAEAIQQGKAHEEVTNVIEQAIRSTRFIFAPATLEYLKRGGRIGNAEAFIGQLLQVKPILTVKEGMTTSLDKVRTRKKSIKYMVDTFLKDVSAYGIRKIVVHHIEAIEEAEKLKETLQEHVGETPIEIISIGPVIGTHVGPGAIGIAYETEREMKA